MISLDVAKYVKFNIKQYIELSLVIKALEKAEERVEVEIVNIENFTSPVISRPNDIEAYCTIMKEGLWEWTPLVATVWDWENDKGKLYTLFDGNHRLAAAIKAEVKEIPIKNFFYLAYETLQTI